MSLNFNPKLYWFFFGGGYSWKNFSKQGEKYPEQESEIGPSLNAPMLCQLSLPRRFWPEIINSHIGTIRPANLSNWQSIGALKKGPFSIPLTWIHFTLLRKKSFNFKLHLEKNHWTFILFIFISLLHVRASQSRRRPWRNRNCGDRYNKEAPFIVPLNAILEESVILTFPVPGICRVCSFSWRNVFRSCLVLPSATILVIILHWV